MKKLLLILLVALKAYAFEDAYLVLPKLEPEDGGFGEMYEIQYLNLGLAKFNSKSDYSVDVVEGKYASLAYKFAKSIYTKDTPLYESLYKVPSELDLSVTQKQMAAFGESELLIYGVMRYQERDYMVMSFAFDDEEYNMPLIKEVVLDEENVFFVKGRTLKEFRGLMRVISFARENMNLPIALRK